jgi:hypothetical protein
LPISACNRFGVSQSNEEENGERLLSRGREERKSLGILMSMGFPSKEDEHFIGLLGLITGPILEALHL